MLPRLRLDCCWKLVSLPELPPSIEELALNGCKKFKSLLKLSPSLEELSLNECKKLVSLPELPPSLRALDLRNCWKLVSLRNFHHPFQIDGDEDHPDWDEEDCPDKHFIFPGDHVTDKCRFGTTENSVTIENSRGSKYDKKCEVYGHFSNLTFRFGLDFLHGLNFDKDIKGCGVFPVYATASELKLVNSSESIDWEQLGPASKGREDLARNNNLPLITSSV
ncbi:hypothetical protein GmHk_12G035856 [Glycine max]|nr:hypothetical protein GmHk_12G035856 [Glycine max]